MRASSATSACGVSASSRRSSASSARSESRWLLTETYSPDAIASAPANSPARPAVRIAVRDELAPATPTTRPAVETIPSLAPSTAARSQFSRAAMPPPCGSGWAPGAPRASLIPSSFDDVTSLTLTAGRLPR